MRKNITLIMYNAVSSATPPHLLRIKLQCLRVRLVLNWDVLAWSPELC